MLKALRAGMPGPFGRTYPLVPAVTRLVAGLESRAAHVYAQRWLRVMMVLRGQAPSLVARSTAGPAAAAQTQLQEAVPWA